jgi:alpha-D-xyloside xylohydrolase
VGSHSDRPDYDYSDGITLHMYQLEDGKRTSVEIPSLNGSIETRFAIRRDGGAIHIVREGPAKTWNVLLVGIDAVEDAGNVELTRGSALIKQTAEMNELEIRLK